MYIHIFKTDIRTHEDIAILNKLFSVNPAISRWTVDMQDVDHVLRIESSTDNSTDIIHTVRQAGYYCADLD